MGKDLECQAKGFGTFPGGSGELFNFFSSKVTGLKMYLREIKPVEEWMVDSGGEETNWEIIEKVLVRNNEDLNKVEATGMERRRKGILRKSTDRTNRSWQLNRELAWATGKSPGYP